MKKLLIFSIAVIFFASGCAPIYIPSSPTYFNTHQKGDVVFTGTLGSYNQAVMAGYAVSDNFNVGLQASRKAGGTVSVGTRNATTSYVGINGFEPQILLGYSNRFTASNVFEVNIGGGPTLSSQPTGLQTFYSGFVQPSILWANAQSKVNTFASVRGTYVNFGQQTGRLASDSSTYNIFIEPTVQVAVGGKMKFTTTLGYSYSPITDLDDAFSPFIMTIGLRYQLRKNRVLD